jgi:hypothetical protein
MGLDAFVYCNCLKHGKTKPYTLDFGWQFDVEDGYLQPNVKTDDEDEYDEKWEQLRDWTADACEHPDCIYASERIANWFGYRKFLNALGRHGWEYFPTLESELPEGNQGTTSPEAAQRMLEELDYFQKNVASQSYFLINTLTDEVIHEYNEAYQGIFLYDGRSGVDIGIDPNGLFIVERTRGRTFMDDVGDIIKGIPGLPERRELFRAMRFEQRLLEPELTYTHQGGKVEYFDADTEDRFVCSAISGQQIAWPDGRMENDQGQVRLDYPQVMHVEARAVEANHFLYIVEPLIAMCKAAIAMDNPIVWC